MLTSLENGLGLDVVIWLQAHGNGVLDLLAELLNITGGSLFVLVLGPVFYWSIDKRLGQQMLIMLMLGSLSFVMLKEIAQTPRPFVAHPEDVTALFHAEGYGIPSGHMITALVFWFPLASWANTRHKWWWFGGFVLLMAWSRIYAGVHYPQDVLAGLIIGLLLIAMYHHYRIGPEHFTTPGRVAGLTVGAVVLIALFSSYEDGLTIVGAFLGMIWGLWLDRRRGDPAFGGSPTERALRYVVGVIVTLAVFFGLRVLFGDAEPAAIWRVLRYGLITLFVMVGWPALFLQVSYKF